MEQINIFFICLIFFSFNFCDHTYSFSGQLHVLQLTMTLLIFSLVGWSTPMLPYVDMRLQLIGWSNTNIELSVVWKKTRSFRTRRL